MIIFENVSKFILTDVTMHIPEGKTVGLIGASGAGKTTWIKLACGLLEPDRGQVYTMRKNPVLHRKDCGKWCNVLFADKPYLQKEDSVKGNFEMLCHIYKVREERFAKEYALLAERLRFGKLEGQLVKNLSLGQRRRAEIGAALVNCPNLLLLDEPTIGLDAEAKQIFYELMEERKRKGMTSVVTSHNMEEISKMCDLIALLEQGKVLFYGQQDKLRKQFIPMDMLQVKFTGKLPDLEDLPLQSYEIEGNVLKITYNSNHTTSAEILRHILSRTKAEEIKVRKADLADIILQMKK